MSSSTFKSSSAFRSSSTFRSSSIIGIIISSSQSSVVPTISTSKNYCLLFVIIVILVKWWMRFSIRRNASGVWFSFIAYTAGVFSASPHHLLYSEEESQEIPTQEYNGNASSTRKRMRRICSYYLNWASGVSSRWNHSLHSRFTYTAISSWYSTCNH